MIVAGGVLAAALVWLALFEHIESEQAEAIHAAELSNTNLVHSYKEHVRRIVSDIELQSETLAADLRREGMARIDLPARHRRLASALPDLLQIAVIDPSGRLVASSLPLPSRPFHAGDTEHFRAHLASAQTGLFIGTPILSHFGKWSIPMTRRLTAAGGAFAGVLVFSVDPEYFSHFFDQAELGKDGVVTVLREDGVVMARRAGDSWSVGTNISEGPLYKTIRERKSGVRLSGGRLDGQIRVIAFDTLKEYPLMVYAGTAVAEVLAPARARRTQQYVAASVITVFIVLVTALVTLLVLREKRIADALRASEQHFRAYFERSMVGMATTSPEKGWLEVNDVLCNMLGYTRDELTKMTWSELTHPEDLAADLAQFTRLLSGEIDGYTMDKRFIRRNGEPVPTHLAVRGVRRRDGTVEYLVALVQDISERKRAEEALRQSELLLRTTIEAAPVVLFMLDAQGVFRMSTGAGLTRLGLKPGEVVGQSVFEVYRNVPDILDCTSRALKGETIDHVQEVAGIFWDTRYVPIMGANARVEGVVGVAVDITELKRAEAAVHALNDELEHRVEQRTAELARANKELESFAYSVSHDLRAPLRAMIGFSEIVLEANAERVTAESVGHLKRIQAGAKRMERLIDDLLSLSRVSRHEMHRTEFDLSRLAQKVADTLAQSERARSVTVTVAPGMRASGDASLVGIVLENLIGNAWKFTSHTDGARIEIGTTQADGKTVYFVRDNGAGFDMQYAHKLFSAFERLHPQETFHGTGIGLSIVQRAVTRQGGRVWAEGQEGRGATFYFTLG